MSALAGNRRAAGRGRKYPRVLRTCVSDEQLERVRENATMAGMSVCRYLRERATGAHISSKLDVKVLQEVNTIGRNLKEMWKQGHDTGPALDAVLAVVERLEQHI